MKRSRSRAVRIRRSLTGIAVLPVLVCSMLLGVGQGSLRRLGFSGATLGSGLYPAFPAVTPDGRLGFDAVWTDSAIMTAQWSATTRTWTRAVPLSTVGVGQSTAQIAASPAGAAVVTWTANVPGGAPSEPPRSVEGRYRTSFSSAWEPSVSVFANRTAAVVASQLAMDGHGDAFAAGLLSTGQIEVAEHDSNAPSWSPPVIVARDTRAVSLELAVSPTGQLAIVWERWLSGGLTSPTVSHLYVKLKRASRASWGRTRSLGTESNYPLQGDADILVPGPRVTMIRSGTVFVTWQWPHGGTYYPRIAILKAANDWRELRTVVLPTAGTNPVIAAGDRGAATVLWEGAQGIEQADLTPNGHVLDSHALLGARHGLYPTLSANGAGDLAAAWGFSFAAVRPAGQSWCPPSNLGTAPQDAQIAIAPDGIAEVVWERYFGKHLEPTIVARTLTPCRRTQ